MMKKVNLKKELKHLYLPSKEKVVQVEVPGTHPLRHGPTPFRREDHFDYFKWTVAFMIRAGSRNGEPLPATRVSARTQLGYQAAVSVDGTSGERKVFAICPSEGKHPR
jgi:hypothetical protein